MALYYVNVKTFNRAKGQSSVNAAAYRAGQSFRDERTGVTHSYLKKAGVLGVFVTTPSDAPAWCSDPEKLWNAAEAVERKNGRPAREVLLALPAELSADQSSDLAKAVTRYLVDRYRVAAMTCVHAPDQKGDARNIHAHILITTREVSAQGFGRKTRVLDDRKTGPKEVESIRAVVARLTNEHLAHAGHAVRVNHTSLLRQSIEAERRGDIVSAIRLIRSSTKHEGQAVTAARRRGERSEVRESNARIRQDNAALQKLFLSKVRSIVMPSRGKVGGVVWATGHDADVLNSQAQALRDTSSIEADASHAYQAMLADVIRNLGGRGPILIDYGRLQGFSAEQILELSHHAHDPRFGLIARNALRAEQSRQHAEGLPARRSRRYAKAMVRTADAARALRSSEHQVPENKRAWAKLRRDQKAALHEAQRREAKAAQLAGREAVYRAKTRAQAAHDRIAALEADRRRRFPISVDRTQSAPSLKAAGRPFDSVSPSTQSQPTHKGFQASRVRPH